jgi:hypothetical protein
VQALRGTTEMPLLGDGDEVPQVSQLQIHILRILILPKLDIGHLAGCAAIMGAW